MTFEVQNRSEVVYRHSDFVEDAVGEQEFTFFVELDQVSNEHGIVLYDYDDFSAWDRMGSVGFTPYAEGYGFPEELSWKNSDESVVVTLYLSYFFD